MTLSGADLFASLEKFEFEYNKGVKTPREKKPYEKDC